MVIRATFTTRMKCICVRRQVNISYAQGGPLSDYRTYSSPTSWGGGEDIIPFTLYQAKCWAMEHMDGDAYEAEFGEVEE